MSALFQEVRLHAGAGHMDEQAVLVLRGGRLTAVLSHLSAMHGDLAGLWFVEAMFGISSSRSRHTFASPDEFVLWLEEEGL